MRSIVRNIAVPACVIAIGAAAIIWNLQSAAATKRKLADEARIAQSLANRGDANGEYDLGRMYLWGRGVPQDYAQADYWYHKAADQGLAKANYAIGDLYYYGDGLEQSYPNALEWYHKAADHGDGVAQDAIGLMYYYGLGVPQSYPDAMVWYRKSAGQGYARAEYDIGYLYEFGLGVTKDHEEASLWFRKAASQGYEPAQRSLGLRFSRLRPWVWISQSILAAGCLLLTSDLFSIKRIMRSQDTRKVAIGGALCFLNIGMYLFEHSEFCLFPSAWLAATFNTATFFLGGVVVTLLLAGVGLKSAKVPLIFSGLLLIGIDLSLCAIARFNLSILSAYVWRFVHIDTLPLGMAISALVLLRIQTKPESGTPEPPAESSDPTQAG